VTDRGLSYQQLDPVGSYASRPITVVMSLGVVLVAGGATALSWSSVSNPITAYLAVLATALSMLGVIYWSSPLRAPFRASGFVIVIALASLSLVLCATSTWDDSTNVVDRWATVTVGLTLVQLSSYRAAGELTAVTILGSLLAGFVTILHPISGNMTMPVLVRVLDAALPLAALGGGAIAYSAVMVRSLEQWYSRSAGMERVASPAARDRVVRRVHDDRVSILNHTVVPFLTDVLARDQITEPDRREARSIASTIRQAMLAEVDRGWLDSVMDDLVDERGDASLPGSEIVQDPYRLAVGMTTEQRIVTRAVIVALYDHPGFDPDGFAILIATEGEAAAVTLTAKLDNDDSLVRSGLAPYLAVLRIAFGDLQVTFQPPTLTLKFSYEHK